MGQFVRMTKYPDATFKDVTAPEPDTPLHDNVARCLEGTVILKPSRHGRRYFCSRCLMAGPDVFQVPGKRTTGTGAQTYAITGPGWSATLPAGSSSTVADPQSSGFLAHLLHGDAEDYAAVHAGPRPGIGRTAVAPTGRPTRRRQGWWIRTSNMKTSVRDQVNALDGVAYSTLPRSS